MMTDRRKAQAVTALRAVHDDIEIDVNRREGLPLTGRNVAVALGEICAQLDIVVRIVEEMLCDDMHDEPGGGHR